jgi:hypothetical protein
MGIEFAFEKCKTFGLVSTHDAQSGMKKKTKM